METKSTLLGQRIRYFRKRSGLSQLELETQIGTSAGSISRIENGEVNPTKETLTKIAEILKLLPREIEYLMGITSLPVSEDQIEKVREVMKPYLQKKGTLAYILDDRARTIDASNDFLRMIGYSPENKELVLGKSIIRIVIDPALKVKEHLESNYEETLYNLLSRFYVEVGFMEDDPYFSEALEYIKSDEIASRMWSEVTSKKVTDIHLLNRRMVKFNIKGFNVPLVYSVEQIAEYPRFNLVEYIPSNLVLRILRNL